MTPEINKFIKLTKRKREIEKELKEINEGLASLQEIVMTQFEQAEIQNINLHGMTLYIGSQLWAKKANENITTEQMILALENAHLGEYATRRINTQGLSAYFRKCEEMGESVPDALNGVIDVSRAYEIKSRLSPKGEQNDKE